MLTHFHQNYSGKLKKQNKTPNYPWKSTQNPRLEVAEGPQQHVVFPRTLRCVGHTDHSDKQERFNQVNKFPERLV